MTILSALGTGLFLFTWSFLFAVLEIAIEGPVGWAQATPTWRKKSRIYGALMGGKDLTGYHLWMFILPLFLLHLPFIFGWFWDVNLFTFARWLEMLAIFFLMCAHWDFQWFVYNPHYGLKRFRKGEISWHKQWLGRAPVDYYAAVALAALFGGLSHLFSDGTVWYRLGPALAVLMLGLIASAVCAPRFQSWYVGMCRRHRIPDDWKKLHSDEELREIAVICDRMDADRLRLAELARHRAQREQLGVPVPSDVRAPVIPMS